MFKLLIYILVILNYKSITFNASCETNQQCQKLYTESYECIQNKCQHKHLEYNTREIYGIILIILVSGICNAGGLGGGAVIIPIYSLIFDYTTGDSIPMSKATILAGAIMNYAIIFNRTENGNPNNLVIDYRLASCIIPLLWAGTMIGVLLTKTFPQLWILILLCSYLIISSKNMFKKAINFTKKENEMFENEKLKFDIVKCNEDNESFIKLRNKNNLNNTNDNELVENSSNNPEIISKFKLILNIIPEILLCILSLGIIVMSTLLKGGHGVSSKIGIEICSKPYWFIFIFSQMLLFLLSLISFLKNKKRISNDDEKMKDIKKLLFFSYICGIGSGLLGIGGGIILNPILLSLGFKPELASALAGFSVLFTSSSTTSQFIVAGAINIKQAATFLIFSSVGSLFGNIIILKLINYFRRPSIWVWILLSILSLCTLVLPIFDLSHIISKGNVLKFTDPC